MSSRLPPRGFGSAHNPEGMPLVAHNLRLVGPKKAAWLNEAFGIELTSAPVPAGNGRLYDPETYEMIWGREA